jgi:hypothetical protein
LLETIALELEAEKAHRQAEKEAREAEENGETTQ